MSILLSGVLGVYNELGEETEIYKAHKIWVTPAGSKRLTYSYTDTVLVTIHPTKETDLEKIESDFIIPENEYIEHQKSIGEIT